MYRSKGGLSMPTARTKKTRTRRINLRATHGQERLIRTGADFSGVPMTEFILKSACLQAEHVLADRRDFAVFPKQWQSFLEILDRPARIKPELARFFSQTTPPGRGSGK
jgi:uncharacterized protein (DUF1778 family)